MNKNLYNEPTQILKASNQLKNQVCEIANDYKFNIEENLIIKYYG